MLSSQRWQKKKWDQWIEQLSTHSIATPMFDANPFVFTTLVARFCSNTSGWAIEIRFPLEILRKKWLFPQTRDEMHAGSAAEHFGRPVGASARGAGRAKLRVHGVAHPRRDERLS